jgi:hypothetical protein
MHQDVLLMGEQKKKNNKQGNDYNCDQKKKVEMGVITEENSR